MLAARGAVSLCGSAALPKNGKQWRRYEQVHVEVEDKLDAILKHLDHKGSDRLIAELDRKYPGRYSATQLK